jgi:MFS family permease
MLFGCITGVFLNTVGVFFQPISEYLQIGRGQFSLAYTCQCLVTFFTLMFSGKLLAKYPNQIRLILTAAILLEVIAYLIFASGTAMWHWYAGSVLVGVGIGFNTNALIYILTMNWFKIKTGTIVGIAMALTSVTGAIAIPAVSYLIQTYSFRSAYLAIAAIAFAFLVPISMFVVRYQPSDVGLKPYGEDEAAAMNTAAAAPAKSGGVPANRALGTPAFWLIIFFTFAAVMWACFSSIMPGYGTSLGYTNVFAATAASVILIGGIVGNLVLGYFNDKAGPSKSVGVLTVLGVAGMALLILNISSTLFLVGAFLFGLAFAILSVQPPILVQKCFGLKDFSAIVSYTTTVIFVGSAVIMPIYNFIYDKTGSYTPGMLVATGVIILAFIAMAIALNTAKNIPWED